VVEYGAERAIRQPRQGLDHMDDQPSDDPERGPFAIDPNVPRIARVENFLVGGQAHFAADQAAAEAVGEVAPGGVDALRNLIESMKAFVARAVTVVSGDLGVRQYLHIGMSTPTTGMVHHVATKVAPGTRVVYVSYDPTTLAHVHTLADDVDDGVVAHVNSSYENVALILREAAAVLDLDQPVGLVLPTSLNLVPDDEVAQRMVDQLHDALAAGSYLVLAHTSLDLAPAGSDRVVARYNELVSESYVVRSKDEIARLVAGFELIEPGLVPVDHWRPDDPTASVRRLAPVYGAVGRRP
jgi:hypothetical protein